MNILFIVYKTIIIKKFNFRKILIKSKIGK